MTETEVLKHFGVKGMKWGVRKSNDSSPSKSSRDTQKSSNDASRRGLSDQQKDMLKKVAIGAAFVAAVGLTAYGAQQVSNYNLEKNFLSDTVSTGYAKRIEEQYGKDLAATFQKGFEFTRSSTAMETRIQSRAFAVSKVADTDAYTSFGKYQYKLEALKDIRVPSTKDRVDALAESFTKEQLRIRARSKGSLGAKLATINADTHKLALRELEDITTDQWSSERSERFIKVLLAKGYSAVPDDMDGNSAHILFDPDAFKYRRVR